MKKINISTFRLVSLILTALICVQCEDVLEENPLDKISSEVFWKNEEQAMQALVGVYDYLQHEYLYSAQNWNAGSFTYFEGFTDNALGAYGWQGYSDIKTGSLIPLNLYVVNRPWAANYGGIGRANRFIDNVVDVPDLDLDEMNVMIAEAKVLRSLFYFNLLVYWDDIPMPLTAQSLDEVNIPKSKATEIYVQIINDLEEAVSILPESWPGDYGRVTLGATQALLSRAYLYGYGYLNMTESLNKAANTTQAIINSGKYGLFPNFQTLFTPENERNNEIIFSIRFTSGTTGNDHENFSGSAGWAPSGPSQPLPNLANQFYCIDGLPIDQSPLFDPNQEWLNRDPRWDATFVYTGEVWLSNRPKSAFNGASTGYGWDKYITDDNSKNTGSRGDYGQDYYLFRYADVLLMRAEALIEMNQNLSEAEKLINMVRARVGMPSISDAEVGLMGMTLNQETLRGILRRERRIELAHENIRFLDLKRWGTMEEAYMNSMGDTKAGETSPILSGMFYSGEKNYILPIPTVELEVNTLLEQHPAW